MPFKLPFIGDNSGSPKDSWISAQELINMYAESNPSDTKGAGEARVVLLPTPGLETLGSAVGDGPIRGAIVHKNIIYVVSGNDFYEVTVAADESITAVQRNFDVVAAVSVLATSTGKVSMASSGNQGDQVTVADGVQLYVYEDAVLTGNITGITNANPGVVTVPGHGLKNGDKVRIRDVVDVTPNGTLETAVNDIDFVVESVTTDTFALQDTDTSTLVAYASGGTIERHRWSSPGFATDTGDNTFGTFTTVDNASIGESGATDAIAWTNPGNAAASDNVDATATTVGQIDTAATNPGTGSTVGSGTETDNDWTDPGNILSSNNADANSSAAFSSGSAFARAELSNFLHATNFSFSIPSAAQIVGVTATIERSETVSGGGVFDEIVQLIVGGTRTGNNKALAPEWPTSDTTATYGSTYDEWGLSLTPTQVNATTFGIALQVRHTLEQGGEGGGSSTTEADVDHVTLQIHYITPTDYLRAVDRSGADLTSTDVITGVEVDIEAAETNAGRIKFQDVRLIIAGQSSGDNKAGVNQTLTGADATYTFGGTGDLWGLNTNDLPSSVINSEQFGVQVSFTAADSITTSDDVQVDFINIKLYYNSAGAVASESIIWFDDYHIVNNQGTGSFYWTANGAQLWDVAVDTAVAQRDPDNLRALNKLDREIWLIGDNSAEAWYNSGDEVPFDPIDNRFVDMGTVAPASVSRWSDGLTWLAKDERGAGKVVSIGNKIDTLSTPQIESLIGKIRSLTDAEAYTYYMDGHEFYVLTFPSVRQTIVYDYTTGMWHQWHSPNHGGRHRSAAHVYLAQRNLHIVGSYETGQLYALKSSVHNEDGTNILRTRVGQSIHSGLLPGGSVGEYRKRLVHHGFELDCTRGRTEQGIADTSSKAKVRLQWSDDGGLTFSSEKLAEVDLGTIGQNFRIRFKSLGQSYDRRYMVTTEADEFFAINDAYVEVSRGTW